MKLIPAAYELISNMRSLFQTNSSNLNYLNEEPLRAELFSSEQMERFGRTLARNHKLDPKPAPDQLLKRLANNEGILLKVRKLLTDSIKGKHRITPAGEWLIDNFYLLEEHIRIAKILFPKGYSENLPQLSNGKSFGHTRIYDIAIQIISHSDGRIDIESLGSFVKSYQTITNLELGELWAIPIMLRLALIENLRRVSSRIAIGKIDGNLADYWSKQMIDIAEKDPKNLILVIADMARSNPPLETAFVSELIRQLSGKGPDLAMALKWIEQQLSESGLTSMELVNAEVQKQAADQVSMSNSIGSLRLLGAMDWRDFVETQSIVEQTLREDNEGIYSLMDFATRDQYRHVVEDIAKRSHVSEYKVASIAIGLMHENAFRNGNDARTAHVGYYLIGPGLAATKKLAKMREPIPKRILLAFKNQGFRIYLFFILLLTLTISAGILLKVFSDNNNIWLMVSVALLSLISVSQFTISVINFFATLLVKPHLLPRMDFSQKIPEDCSTLIVIPAMLTNTEETENLIEALEVRFLANRNVNLHFGLLSDFTDAKQETLPGDQELIDLAKRRIEDLNKKYRRENNDLFFLFHRPRKWNSAENAWMGYERKRGKLAELNSLLRGGAKENFSVIVGDQSVFPHVRYVITLDSDTQLPLATAWKLIGAMAHPLNRPWYDEKKKRVTKGYGILQPRVAVSLPDKTSSLYARMHGNEPGIDPYTRASSDVYQDLFGEGSFIGKGIYDVDIFIKTLEGRFSENVILSHDLLEGCYVRSGLLSDVNLFEKYPTTYRGDMKRRARWVRGDWQIFSWFLPFVHDSEKHFLKNPLSALSRWKIFDNIRRSLVPVSVTLLILIAWVLLKASLFWTMVISGIIVMPVFISTVWDIIRKPKEVILVHHIKNSFRNIAGIFVKTLFMLICLPYEAFFYMRAIVNTLWRMVVSKKKLLEWNPSANEEKESPSTFFTYYRMMWIEPFLTVIVLIFLYKFFPQKLNIAVPILILWILAPLTTWWISMRLAKLVTLLTHDQNLFLRRLSRKTWSFFERFVTEEDNWLPPDNFQEQPVVQLAHRTSPTNIGLAMLSSLTASEFGYISIENFIQRTTNTINTLEIMERYKGHFYNWYNTETLEPLYPRYISTVDSGNLAGHLLVLKQGLLSMPHRKIPGVRLLDGLLDTFMVLRDTLGKTDLEILSPFGETLENACLSGSVSCREVNLFIEELTSGFNLILEKLKPGQESETSWWASRLKQQLEEISSDYKIFAPWLLLEDAPLKFRDFPSADLRCTLSELIKKAADLKSEIKLLPASNFTATEIEWLGQFQNALEESSRMAGDWITRSENLARQCDSMADMEWNFLYNSSSNLLTIGYNVNDHEADESYYDLLASEVRLCTFVIIAQGKLPEESWFALGRLLTNVQGNSILLSWSGSMFEYLMPLLVMPTYENTLLDQTCKAAVKWQIEYGKQRGSVWGVSESGYNMLDSGSNYQYRAFGAQGLGLKRGLEEDSVVAPYASVLALMVEPEKACKNLELLYSNGLEGRFGLYEAVDYTLSRLQTGQTRSIIYSFMAHHQGMSLLSLAYLLLDRPMQKLFEAEPQFKATLLLLQERIPKASTFFVHTTDIADVNYVAIGAEIRNIHKPDTPVPEVQLLSNGKYHVMITNAGSGYSRWKDLAVTRWHEDGTRDNRGIFCYIKDVKSDHYWSNTYQPTLKMGEKYDVAYSQGRVDFHTTYNEIETHTEIVVSPEDDIEMRRLIISNCSAIQKTIEVTSYAEVVLASGASDAMQPAFNNLFVETEILPHQHAIICTRRPRSKEEKSPWMLHLMSLTGKEPEEISYETNRMEFIGRGNTSINPLMMNKSGPLAGNQGSVLDPIVAIRYKITLEPDEKVVADMIIGMGETREICMKLSDKYQDKHHKDRVFDLAWTHSQVVLRQINASEADAQMYGRLASSILYVNPAFRADPEILINNHRGQSGLWGYSVSGDLPIVLLKIEKKVNIQLVQQLVQAHSYWRLKGLAVDLVIWNGEHNGYRQVFQDQIMGLIPAEIKDRPGGIFVIASDRLSNEDRILFQTVARVNISDDAGTFIEQIKRRQLSKLVIPYLIPIQEYSPSVTSIRLPENLIFFNGLGGFSRDADEYIIEVEEKTKTPAPWVNVLANPNFGSVISESGTAYSWTENAHELRLTPWNNDPVSDTGGEAFYIRDYENGHFWSPTLLPSGGRGSYIVRHGFGYSVFEHIEDGIHSEMTVFVDKDAAVKFTKIKICNQSGRFRKLSATGYAEWVLGDDRSKTAMQIHTESDPETGALLAKNAYNSEFSHRVAFFDVDYLKRTFTSDRTEFIGRNGSLQNPDAMSRQRLSGRVGLALDPCAAIQVPFELEDGEEKEIIFRLGAGKDITDAIEMIRQFRGVEVARDSLNSVKNYWKSTIGMLQVETPDKAINIIANGWLTYQTLSSRLWGRTGFYQSGGAFGFRDQLQDVLSLLHISPQSGRKQILLCASRQFVEGDVQHWWHPPLGRGIRTLCADDYLWLPFVTAVYVAHTGDAAILEEPVNYLEGRLLNPEEESYYDLPIQSVKTGSLYDHCEKAIEHGLKYGSNGMPFIGTGDWNDGYDKVGNKGKGESVWMAFFLYEILIRFEEIANLRHAQAFADKCKKEARKLKANIDKNAWDGAWYKRAWFDNGTPLGASINEECKIDSIAQSWSVLSGAGDPGKVVQAMESSYKLLVQKDTDIIKLLEPPFDKSELNPGYIKGYVPGVRENGGQYTHAAVWMIMAFARLGNNKRVWELLEMINPVNHGKTSEAIATYKVEPYVLAADVYAMPPHAGRGGWTWYTGSAGWMYRLITESFLGLHQEADQMTFAPCVPQDWATFSVHYRYEKTLYHINFTQQNGPGEMIIALDGNEKVRNSITLVDDGLEHEIKITFFSGIEIFVQ